MNVSFSVRKFRAVWCAAFVLASLVVAVPPSFAEGVGDVPSHCVADVASQTADGELILGSERCYERFSDAMRDVTGGALVLPEDSLGDIVFTDGVAGAYASWFTLGIHYDGYYGTGSSISVRGSSCTGGYWNPVGWWANRVSSSYNGCYHLKHHDKPNRSGTVYNTYGKYQTDNIGSVMNNRTESISYWSY